MVMVIFFIIHKIFFSRRNEDATARLAAIESLVPIVCHCNLGRVFFAMGWVFLYIILADISKFVGDSFQSYFEVSLMLTILSKARQQNTH